MFSNPHHPPPRSRLTPFLVFGGIVVLSAVFFIAFTWPHWRERFGGETAGPAAPQTAETAVGNPSASVSPQVAAPPGKAASSPGAAKKRAASAPPVLYAKPEALLDAIGEALRQRNLDRAFKIIGKEQGNTPQADFMKLLLARERYRVPAAGALWTDAGRSGGAARYALKLEPSSVAAPAPAGPLWLETERDREAGTFRISRILPSPALVTQGLELLPAQGITLDPAPLQAAPDALTQTHLFLTAVLGRDFQAARAATDRGKISQEKLAGLCIVFEEGDWKPAAQRPVSITASGDKAALALARVQSAKGGPDGEIGLTLHPDAGGNWRITAIDFNRLLEAGVKAAGAGAGGVFYSPILKSPRGGESLVVYFDFNSAELVKRALVQLDIVAAVLKTDPARRLRITGHADDLGTDDFNYKLSAARAKNVRARLQALGVSAEQIETIGFGASAPVVSNKKEDGSDNPEGRSRNRRTEIYLDF